MRRSLALLATICLALAAQSSAAEKKDKQAEGRVLIERASELSDIRAPGSPPFRLKTSVRIVEDNKKTVEGSYLLLWASPSQWREEIVFPSFNQLRVVGEGKMWQVRNNLSLLLHVERLRKLLDLPGSLMLNPETKVKKIREHKRDGHQFRCIELGRKDYDPWKVCLASADGSLTLIERSISGYEYSDYKSVGEKQYPRMLRRVDREKTAVEVSVEQLGEERFSDQSPFTPPPGVQEWVWCENPEPARALEWGESNVQVSMSQRGWFPVAVYGVIGVDGRVHDITVLRSARPDIDARFLEQLRGARFEPKKCNGVSVEEERVFESGFNFH